MREQVVRLKHKKAIRNWTMTQVWEHVIFAHWPVSPEAMRKLIPEQLKIDTFGGKAWIGIVLFLMNGFKLRVVPIRYPFSFPEINIRTYVKVNGVPAVFFITLDAANAAVVRVAKCWYRLPYFNAEMSFQGKAEKFLFHSRRKSVPHPVTFHGEFHPASDPFIPEAGTIEHWLTERYVYFNKSVSDGNIYRGEVYHGQWSLRTVRGMIHRNTMLYSHNIALSDKPQYLHYARGVEALMGAPERYDTHDNVWR